MPNVFDIPIDSECRHIISFGGYSENVNISDKLKSFFRFVYNKDGRRVSFVTEKNSNYNKLLTDRIFPTEIFSTDPQIKIFNEEFLKTNKQIPFEHITTYDMQTRPLKSFEDTVKEIERLGKTYWTDLLLYPEICKMSPHEFFCFVKSLKYIADPKGEEYVTRPGHTLNFALSGNGHYFDCDDRTVLSISYFTLRNKLLNENNKITIIVSGRHLKPHHVYCDVNGKPFDPTYPYNIYQKVLFREGFRKEYPVK